MKNVRRHSRTTALLAGVLSALLFGGPALAAKGGGGSTPPPVDPSGDDLFLLSAATSPNVVLVMDNSRSMNNIEWHPSFDPDQAPDASYCTSSADFGGALDPDTVYTVSSDMVDVSCDTPARGLRTVYGPNDPTYWNGRYLMWYLGLDESDTTDQKILQDIATSKANIEGCTLAGGAKFFNKKYRRTRLEAQKQVLMDLLCLAEPKNVRFAVSWFRETEDAADEDPNGGYLKEDLGRSNPNHAAELEAAIKNADVNDDDVEATPLSETLFQVLTYFMSRDAADIPVGADGVTKFPAYQYDKFGTWETDPGKFLEDSLLADCEKAFVVLVTDGISTRDDFDEEETTNEATGFTQFDDLVGDYHDEGADLVPDAEEPGDADEKSFFLDDIALWAQTNDIRPDLGGDQFVDTYTIGLATDPATDAYLQMTADVGNGLFFHTDDGDELAIALIAALNDIIEKAASFTAAAVPSARTVDGGDFYQSYFFPQSRSAAWEGHIRAWKITASGDIVDKFGLCALDDPDAGECNSGPFLPSAEFFWDAHEEMPQPASRTLYASKRVGGNPDRVDFNPCPLPKAACPTSLNAADLLIDPFTDDTIYPPDISPNDPLYQVFGSRAKNHEGLAEEVIHFARGCFFATGPTDATLVDSPEACLARPNRLADIFHSNPIVVKRPDSPVFTFLEPSYKAFKNAYSSRSRMIYAGANGGFLEAIEAGSWVTSPAPPHYTEGTGVEQWGFMPWSAREIIRNLPIDSPTDRTQYVDGSPQVSDVWIHPTPTTITKNVNGSEWRTMLMTGMRRGGRIYLGLDITNPDGITGPAGDLEWPGFQGATGPAHGWEFPPEGDPDGWLPHMGFTYGKPILTRVRVTVDGGSDVLERWVGVVTAGYDENGDPTPDPVTGRSSLYDASATEGRGIFLIDLKTGKPLARKILDASASDAQTEMLSATPMTPAVFDLNNDLFADVIVFGDLRGNLFKWVINAPGGDPINGTGAGDDVDQPNWPFVKIFEGPVESDKGDDYYQSFWTSPAGALVGGKLWLAWGASERNNLAYVGDASIDENNRLYVLFDPTPMGATATVDEDDLADATSSPGGITLTTERGFYIKGADGEKFVTNSVIFAGQVITSSFTPTPNADPCVAKGQATAYVFDLLTGEGFFQDGAGNPERKLDIGAGLPTDPKVSVGPGGKQNRVYIEKSGADLESFGASNIPAGGQLLYWREVP